MGQKERTVRADCLVRLVPGALKYDAIKAFLAPYAKSTKPKPSSKVKEEL